MKIRTLFLLILIATLPLLAEELPFQPEKNRDEWIQPINREAREIKIKIIPYAQSVFFFPGCGVSLRFTKQHFGVQGDINVTHINFYHRSTWLQTSISGVYYPFAVKGRAHGGLNMTLGIRSFYDWKTHSNTNFMWGPLSIGYEGKNLFFDVGVSPAKTDLKFLPSLKVGICF